MSAPRQIGPIVDATPAAGPGPVRLEGGRVRVEKLDLARHGAALWDAVQGDDTLWDYMAYGPFRDRPGFMIWLEERAALLDPYSYAVVEQGSGLAVGIVTLMEIRPSARVIEIGNIVYAPRMQRTPGATEVQYLVAGYVFDDLHYRRYEWKCNALNDPSRRAALRLGFTYEGTFRQHMIVKGRNRDTAWYAITGDEWPRVKAAFEQWLAPGNFDDAGNQRTGLAEFRKRETK